jgi:arylsulfatase
VINLYDGETAYMDRHLRSVFKALEPVQDDTLVILTADHGEIMDEQLGFFDHHGLYEGNIHVPLIFYWPGKLPRGKRVPGFVQNLDIAPTLLELAGIVDKDRMEGKSLLPTVFGLRDGNYEVLYFSEATWEVKRAIRTERWKLIDSIEQDPHGRPMQELFDLANDPTEQRNVASQYPEVVAELKAQLDKWVAQRLKETKRKQDPAAVQGRCGFKIGTEIPGEIIGPGATPLHKRKRRAAADIPKPDALKAPNEVKDAKKGAKLHGYVKQENEKK